MRVCQRVWAGRPWANNPKTPHGQASPQPLTCIDRPKASPASPTPHFYRRAPGQPGPPQSTGPVYDLTCTKNRRLEMHLQRGEGLKGAKGLVRPWPKLDRAPKHYFCEFARESPAQQQAEWVLTQWRPLEIESKATNCSYNANLTLTSFFDSRRDVC